ncbi:MAG TPA: ABC transporter ATP-binding protein, partial [Ilumatobacteraceae bacterium]|nr:ABC transporter ATP-binding protein [Ilumatobacteraceae bacterium]
MLRGHLRPYRSTLLLVTGLQLGQTVASLFLPSINAHVIDKGVRYGDTGYIWRMGSVMLLVALVQIAFAVAAVYFGARTAMA